MRAALHGHVDFIEPLLRGGCRPNETVRVDVPAGWSLPTHVALCSPCLQAHRATVLTWADLGWWHGVRMWLLPSTTWGICLASAKGHAPVVERLLKFGAGMGVDVSPLRGWFVVGAGC